HRSRSDQDRIAAHFEYGREVQPATAHRGTIRRILRRRRHARFEARAMTAAKPDPRLRDFLRDQHLVKPDDDAIWTPLTGGVSSDIWRVDLPDRTLCIKCALPE